MRNWDIVGIAAAIGILSIAVLIWVFIFLIITEASTTPHVIEQCKTTWSFV